MRPPTSAVARRARKLFLVAAAAAALAACGGASAPKVDLVPAASGMQVGVDGFSFPNFPSEAYADEFDTADVVSMFGSDDTVCVGGVAEPCELTAEAAAFARLVNQSRATGHCEGLVALGLSRFNDREKPVTVELPDKGDVLHGIMRAFATQFIPEVQQEVRSWLKRPLMDKLAALTESIATGKLKYTLGLYVEGGGHALLPYAIEYPTPGTARVMVYDSNWPARNRWVDFDTKTEKWSFSFSGEDPANDPDMWTGDGAHMDLTSIDSRRGSCPFCGDGSVLSKNTLVVRTSSLNWSVDVNGTVVSPQDPSAGEAKGITLAPVKAGTSRSAYDYVITLPQRADGGSTTTTGADETTTQLLFSGTASVFAVTPAGIAQISTPGNIDVPVVVTNTSVASKDPAVKLSLASGNLVATASGPSASLEIGDGGNLAVTVEAANGQIVTQSVTPESPAAAVSADAESGGVTVLAQSSSGEVVKRDVAPDGSETKSVSTVPLNLNSTSFDAPKGLESKQIASLPPVSQRNLDNPDYKADPVYVPPTTVPRDGKVGSQDVAPARTVVGKLNLPEREYGDAPFMLTAPSSNSDATFVYSSSDPDVASVTQSGRVTVNKPGTTTITAAQAPTSGFTQGSASAVLHVGKGTPRVGTVPVTQFSRRFGDDPFQVRTPESSSDAPFTFDSSDPKVARVSPLGRVTVTGVGTAIVTMSQPANENWGSVDRKVTVTVGRRIPTVAELVITPRTFGDADFKVTPPATNSSGTWSFSSSDTSVIDFDAVTGNAVVKGAGTTTVRALLAQTSTDESASESVTLTVSKASPVYGSFTLPEMDASSLAAQTVTLPRSTSPVPFVYASSNTSVVTVNASTGRVSVVAPGTAIITATQPEGPNHRAGSVSATLTVNRAVPVLGALTVGDRTYGSADFTLQAPSSDSDGAFVFTSTDTSVATVNASTGVVHVTGVGTTSLRAAQAPTVRFTGAAVSTTFTVARGTQSALVVTTTSGTAGTPLALASSGGSGSGAVTYTVTSAGTAGCTVSGQNLSGSAGTCTVTATKAQDANYLAASSSPTTVTFASSGCAPTYSVSGAYTVAQFTTAGTCQWTVPAGVTTVEYLVVAGGGGGGAGGGGAGGLRTNVGGAGLAVTAGNQVTVTVGAGGAAGSGAATGSPGGDSTFGSITSIGGGGGGGSAGHPPTNGGSGGGGGWDQNALTRTTGTAGQGNGGGRSCCAGYGAGAGGGGAGAAGSDTTVLYYGAAGGDGLQNSITGTATWYAGGGGGGINANWNHDAPGYGGTGGRGGGGNGSNLGYSGSHSYFDGTAGTANTGGGGGGTDPESSVAGAGGSGVVIVRYSSQISWGQATSEMQSFTITAPAGNKIVGIVFASYGTPTGSNGVYSLGACNAATSVSKISELALGRSTVVLTQDVALFGDPCVGTYKRLYVTVAFGT